MGRHRIPSRGPGANQIEGAAAAHNSISEMESAGQTAQTAIFAASGAARHRLVRVAIVAGFALLAAWAVALALGVMGGFGSLPMLPGARSHHAGNAGAGPASAPAPAPASTVQPERSPAATRPDGPATSGGRPMAARPHATPPPALPQRGNGRSNGRASNAATSSGHGYGSTRTTPGKPAGTPGNPAGGSGAPGRLR